MTSYSYLYHGVVLPERAQLSLQTAKDFSHLSTGFSGSASVSIILNQIAVWIKSDHEWDIFDLRNVVKKLVQGQLDMIGYVQGYAYDCEIIRVLCVERNIDYVFGIDIPCLSSRNKSIDLQIEIVRMNGQFNGDYGIYLQRSFSDLNSAMKHADDTGFFCYRAIESLRHHCAAVYGLSDYEKIKQWKKFREIALCDESLLLEIKDSADVLRHGGVYSVTSDQRADLLLKTWGIVDTYLKNYRSA